MVKMFVANIPVCFLLITLGSAISEQQLGYTNEDDDRRTNVKREAYHPGYSIRQTRKAFIKLPTIHLPKIPSPKDVIRHIGGHLGFHKCHHGQGPPGEGHDQHPNYPHQGEGYYNHPPPHGVHYPHPGNHNKPNHWMGNPMNFPHYPNNPDMSNESEEISPPNSPDAPNPPIFTGPSPIDRNDSEELPDITNSEPELTPNTQITQKPESVEQGEDSDVWVNKSDEDDTAEEKIAPTTPLIDIRFGE